MPDLLSGEIAGAVKSAGNSLFAQISGAKSATASQLARGDLRAAGNEILGNNLGGAVNLAFGVTGKKSPTAVPTATVAGKLHVQRLSLADEDVSQWGRLNPKLFAEFRMINPESGKTEYDYVIRAPITDSTFDMTLNWQSPFENTGPESKAPALMALIQSGQIGIMMNALQAAVAGGNKEGNLLEQGHAFITEETAILAKKATDFAASLQGKTGITKVNSRQVFTGMPPVKITMTIHFRAFKDPIKEVLEPYRRLLSWAVPEKLAEQGALVNTLKSEGGIGGIIRALFPSTAPPTIELKYANERYSPLVIEAVSRPFDGPLDSKGNPTYRAVQLTLATLTAIDRDDVKNIVL